LREFCQRSHQRRSRSRKENPIDQLNHFNARPLHTKTHTQRIHTTHSLIHSFTHSLIHSFTHSLIHSFTHPLIHSFTQPLIHSTTHSLNHSFTHSLIISGNSTWYSSPHFF